jgi:hypothetical protein
MIMKKQKCVDVPQVEFVDRVVEVPVHLQVLLEKELVVVQPTVVGLVDNGMKGQIPANFEVRAKELAVWIETKGKESIKLLNAGEISVEEYCDRMRTVASSS